MVDRGAEDMYPTFQIGVGFLLQQENKILLGLRAPHRDYGAGIWEIPAGRLEAGETPEAALTREAREELGIEVTGSQIIGAYQFMRHEQPMLLLTYLCGFRGEIVRSDEHQELRWVSPAEAVELFDFEKQKHLIKRYFQLR